MVRMRPHYPHNAESARKCTWWKYEILTHQRERKLKKEKVGKIDECNIMRSLTRKFNDQKTLKKSYD